MTASRKITSNRALVVRLSLALVGALLLVAIYPVGAAAKAAPMAGGEAMVRVPGHVLPALAKATVVPSRMNQDNQPMTLTIVLRHDDQAGLNRYLRDLYDPHSPNFHHYLTQSEIADRFGPSAGTYRTALEYLSANGFELLHGSANRLTLTVRGTRAKVERAFDIRIKDYRIGRRDFYASDRDPALPANLASRVQSVGGLSNLAHVANTIEAAGKLICTILFAPIYPPPGYKFCNYNPTKALDDCINSVPAWAKGNGPLTLDLNSDLTYFNVVPDGQSCNSPQATPLTKAEGLAAGAGVVRTAAQPAASSLGGAGQTIGLVEFDTFEQSDVANYFNLIGLPSANLANLSTVDVNGGATPGSGQDEVLLDIDTVMTLAEEANVKVYDAPFEGGSSFEDVFNQMIDDKVTVISNSWSYCEDETDQADVDSIDSVLSNAAAAGISVFNGAGDSGSTCLDGSSNTIGVPADSPHATAVGGTTQVESLGGLYGTETWWDGVLETPPTGQGGFGISKFFTAPSYQAGLSTMRSIPDVVTNADPSTGVEICQASAGGCPSNLFYGGTSIAAPIWASYAAIINQAVGTNLGLANTALYPLAGTSAFHDAVSMGTDFQHVGLGSPNLDQIILALSHQTAGPPSAAGSIVTLAYQDNDLSPILSLGVPADGATTATVVVLLADANGNTIPGKTVTLSASPSANAMISPASAVTNTSNGAAVFTVTDLVPEALTFTATDITDSLPLSMTPTLPFVTPPAASAGLDVFPTTQAADGMSPVDITVTLQDSLGRPTPGKLIQINQSGGTSLITGPIPPVTDSSGMIEFTAVDSNNETITYSAVDVTDGNLPFPATGMVTFSNSQTGCSNTLIAAPGFVATPYATGFQAQDFSFGGVNFGLCPGAWGVAFDPSGNLYVSDIENGNLYKFPPGGGVAGPSTLVANIGTTLASLVFDQSGNLYGSRTTTGGNFTTGAVFQIDPATGAIIRTVASNMTCPTALSLDPISGDLFTDDSCGGGGSDNPGLFEISGLNTNSPTTSLYTNLPNTPNANIAFSPSGDMYIWDNGQGVMVTATNGPNPPVVTPIAGLGQSFLGMQAYGTATNGGAQFLIANFPADTSTTPNSPPTISVFDLTTATPTISTPLLTNGGTNGGANNMTTGPGGCIYMAQGVAVWKITDSTGGCDYFQTLSLTPSQLSTNPAQGSSVSLTAQFHNLSVPDGTPVTLKVSGANQRLLESNTAGGAASFSYTGAYQGIDTIVATATLNGASINSNTAVYTWGPGTDLTFLSLNQSPTSSVVSQAVTLTSNLTDVSQKPAVALSGQQVNFSLGGSDCQGTTDTNGNATCQVTPSNTGVTTLSANFAGASQYNASSDSRTFNVLPTPTIPPVAGKLKISPSRLNFGSVDLGSSKVDTLKITNAGKTTKKSKALPIVIEMESVTPSAFAITTSCEEQLAPGAKGVRPGTCNVQVKFTPGAAMKFSGSLKIMDNVDPSLAKKYPPLVQTVPMTGAGKAAK